MFGDLKLVWELWGYWRQIKGGTMSTETMLQLATLLIPFIAPLITVWIKKLLPSMPKLLVVILQPILGAILGAFTVDNATAGVLAGGILGGAGVAVRETVDQGKKAISALAAGNQLPRITPPGSAV